MAETRVETHPLIAIRSAATVQDAATLMTDCSIGALGVLGAAKEFVGIVTERDLAWFVAQGRDAKVTTVAEIVNDFPVIVEGPIEDRDALGRMMAAHIRHLIVREGEDFRIVSSRDYLPSDTATRIQDDDIMALHVMTTPAVVCREDDYFEDIAELLAERNITGMPVVDDAGRISGVVSERDLVHALGGPMVRLALRRHNHSEFPFAINDLPRSARRARDIMSTPPIAVAPNASIEEMAHLLASNQISRLPVLAGGRPVGIVTRSDVLTVLARRRERVIDVTETSSDAALIRSKVRL